MNSRGFTLIEVIIAITLLGLMMLGVYNVVDTSISTKETTLGEDREVLLLETALTRLEKDVESLYSPLFFSRIKKVDPNDEEENANEVFTPTEKFQFITEQKIPVPHIENPDKQTIVFMTSTNRRKTKNSNQSHYAWVKYTLEDDGEHESFVRYFSAKNPYAPEHDWDSIKAHILIPKVKKLVFEFWDSNREKYVDSIELTKDQNIFHIIKINITWIDRYDIEQKVERVFRTSWPYFDTNSDIQEEASKTEEDEDE